MANLFPEQERKITGARYVPFKSQLLVSSGVVSVDSITGGGLPVGTLLLIEEPETSVYSLMMLKHFLAEGVVCGHSIFVGSLETNPQEVMSTLPAIGESESLNAHLKDEEMHIAWRYQNSPMYSSQIAGNTNDNFGHNFDVSKVLPEEYCAKSNITCWPKSGDTVLGTYSELLECLKSTVETQKNRDKSVHQANILRIGLQSLGSYLWRDPAKELPNFLFQLRSVVHNSNSICMLTVSTSLIEEASIISRCEHLCDGVFVLESLGEDPNPLYVEYNGLLKIKKLSAINTMASQVLEYSDWAYILHKKKFLIERMHLPPKLETTTEREQDDLASYTEEGSSQSQL